MGHLSRRSPRLEARVNELEVETTKLTTAREILQRAGKYFAGETRLRPLLKAAPVREEGARADGADLMERIRAV